MLLCVVFGIIIGAVGALYLVINGKKKGDSATKENSLNGTALYLNFFIHDKNAAVQKVATEKIQQKIDTGFFANKFANQMGKNIAATADVLVSDSITARKMSDKIVKMMPTKMQEMGIQAQASCVYQKDAFFVIKLIVISADLSKIVGKVAGAEKAGWFNDAMAMIGGKPTQDMLGKSIVPVIVNKMEEKIPEKVREKFEEKGMDCDIVVKSEGSEADYFFDMISTQNDKLDAARVPVRVLV